MSIRAFLSENPYIQVRINSCSWEDIINKAAKPLIEGGFITPEYPKAVIKNTLEYGAYYVFDEGIAIPHARPECGVLKNCFSMMTLSEPVSINDSEPVDIVIMFGGVDGDAHITDGIASIVGLLEKEDTLSQIRRATTIDEILGLL
ncbi:PTS system IIA component (L-Asc family) [Gibbsiella quercinecans]|uniref:Ascorbate-specific PTS system EIIA component n=2 Tax=Gibbsiella TaxID=929812 RepID=A0A250B093_9GAMM|nr:PTS sugar transporter subunit IIA [Gibbsiella quercinecans]ATA19567.1 PTS fructose transporter subunit IIA [Gibbsiella quercinecans]RLM06513.1 PTS fructose transporter subunit IIA [Gibbsiella quercinecans]RLM11243.1 PTS fructose transporter subunit IIA [Gibbsiella quercinecans]TCT83309.1 PTS system IIA component (L-Asc family) [Gibbsiella quercinecans]